MTQSPPTSKWVSPVIPWKDCGDRRKQVLREAWTRGELSYKLSPKQRAIYDEMRRWASSRNRQGRKFVLDCSRRLGKSSILLLVAFEDAIRRANARVVYYGPTHKDLMKFIREHMGKMVMDCPPDIAPTWVKTESLYQFPNGSVVEFIGLDRNPDGARGGAFDTGILDEAGFFDNLENIVQSVLLYQMMGKDHARIYAGSTPPISPAHYWSQVMVPQAVLEGACMTRTIEDSDIYSLEEKEEFIREAGGRKSSKCRRELFAEHITDESMAIVPEFREVREEIVKALDAPTWRNCFVAMDPGWKDHTAVLFGYWHFEDSRLVVEDEIAAPRMNSSLVAELIKRKELVLWDGSTRRAGHSQQMRPQPFLRISDNDPRLLFDLANDHKLVFTPTQKDNLDQQINGMRVAFSEKRIWIHPRCKMLVSQLNNGVWQNEARKVFAREGGDMGHFDLIAALVYLWRNASMHKSRNPAPFAQKYVAGDLMVKDEQREGQAPSKWAKRGGRIFFKGSR